MLFAVPAQLGYPVLAALVLGESAGLPLPGETALLTAGGLAAAGHVRVVTAVMAGATRMPWRRFAVANALGAFAWASTVATTAALLGPIGAAVLAATGLTFGALSVAVGWWRQRRARRLALAAL